MIVPEANRLRIAAISFLNPAPLLWDFEHEPAAARLAARYDVRYTLPAQCADQLATGEADLGLVPIAALAGQPGLSVVPGCVIASPFEVRSIQLVLRPGVTLGSIRTLATDAASRSSAAYVRTMLHHFYGVTPEVHEEPADLPGMLAKSDAALLIGDHALLALEERDSSAAWMEYTWIDVAAWWHGHTGLPWVAAVWAVRPEALVRTGITREELIADLQASRDAGLRHIPELVRAWEPRLPLAPGTIHDYLTRNIQYVLDEDCARAVDCFYRLAAEAGILPPWQMQRL